MRSKAAAFAAAVLCCVFLAAADAQQFGFAAPVQFDAGKNVIAVWPYADMDHDGLMDIVSVDTSHTLTVRRRTSPLGTAFASVAYRTETLGVGTTITDMAVAQLVDYPYPNVVLAVDGGIVVVHNAGPGAAPNDQLQLSALTPLTAGAGTYLDHVKIADWDGSNGPDLIATGLDASSQGILAIFPNNGNGTWGAATITPLTHPVENLQVCDFTHDGRPEVAVVYRDDGAVGVWQNPGDGTAAAVNEFLVSFPTTRPVAVVCADLSQHTSFNFPDLVVVGSARSTDGTKNQITLSVAQNRSPIGSKSAFFGAQTTFALPGVVGADNAFSSDAYATDLDADGRPEIVVADNLNGAVAVFQFAPSETNGVVTSWGTPTITEYPCNASPRQVFASTFAGSSYTDLVTCNEGGAGVNVLLGGPPAQALNAATNLSFNLGTGTGAKVKYAAVASGASVKNGSNCRFNCRNANSSASGLRIRVQATTTPDDESSWTDLPGPLAGGMGQDVASGDYVLYQQNFPIGAEYFRTVSSAPGSTDGIDRDLPTSGSPTKYIGPFNISGGQPARLLAFTSIHDTDDGVATSAVPGDTLRVSVAYRNEGDVSAKVDLWAQIPPGCAVVQAGGGKKKGEWVTWKNLVVAPHSGDVVKTFDVTVGSSLAAGAMIQSADTALGPKLALKRAAGGALVLSKGAVQATVNNAAVFRPSIGVVVRPDVASAKLGDTFGISFDVTNNLSVALPDTKFFQPLQSDQEYVAGYYLDAQGKQIPNFPAFFNSATRVVSWAMGTLNPGQTATLRLVLRVRYDRAPSGATSLAGYSSSGSPSGGGSVTGDKNPPAATVTVSGPSTTGAPRLQLSAGAFNPSHPGDTYSMPDLGDVPYAYGGETIQYQFVIQNVGDATADHCILHAAVPPGTDLDTTSFTAAVPFTVLSPIPASGSTIVTGPADVAVDFGDQPADGILRLFAYNVRVRTAAESGGAKPGSVVSYKLGSLTSESFAYPSYMRPIEVPFVVLQPKQPVNITHKEVTHSAIDVGDSMTITYTLRNDGDGPIEGVQATFGFGTLETCTGATVDGSAAPCAVVNGDATIDVGEILPGASNEVTVAATVKLVKRPLPNQVYVNTLDVTAPTKASGTTALTNRDVEYTNVKCGPSGACLFVLLATKALVTTQQLVPYDVVVGNMSDQTAHGVVVETNVPKSGSVNSAATVPTPTVNKKTGVATFVVGDLAPHETKLILLSVERDPSLAVGSSILNSATVYSSNAPAKQTGVVTTTIRDVPDYFASADATRSFYLNGVTYGGGNGPIDDAVAALKKDTVEIALAGADFTLLSDGVIVVPMGMDKSSDATKNGRGYALAFGSEAELSFTGPAATLVDELSTAGAGGVNFVGGFADGIVVKDIACSNVHTAADALDQLHGLIACAAATEVSVGAGNGVDATGTNLVANSANAAGGTLSVQLGANAVGQRNGAAVVGGSGNTLSAGSGDRTSGPATASGTGKVLLAVPAAIVAAGGGNIVAAGAGNIVAAGAGNILGNSAAGIVAAGAGNILGNSASGIVAAGAGNVVAQGAGNIVAAGAGNIVAAGAGN